MINSLSLLLYQLQTCCQSVVNISYGCTETVLFCYYIFICLWMPSSAISKLENLATHYLKKRLGLPRCATQAILYYPGVCCPSISVAFREAKLSLLSCISTSGDPELQQLIAGSSGGCLYRPKHLIINFNLRLVCSCHLFQYLTLFICCQRSCMLVADECSRYDDYLDTLSVQCKPVCLESCCKTWNRLLLGCHPGHLSFILQTAFSHQ